MPIKQRYAGIIFSALIKSSLKIILKHVTRELYVSWQDKQVTVYTLVGLELALCYFNASKWPQYLHAVFMLELQHRMTKGRPVHLLFCAKMNSEVFISRIIFSKEYCNCAKL